MGIEPVGRRHFHTFLSHVWGTGQDQMRIIKQRLLEMIPELSVFLDVDDLEEIGDLEGYIERTTTILVYCSRGYFTSKNCMRELVSSTEMRKPIIALIDSDASRGGLSLGEIQTQVLEADGMYAKWEFNQNGLAGQELYDHLFAHDPIEWNRIGHFQDVTMRLIAERLLPDGNAGTTYVDKELVNAELTPLPPCQKSFHIYCSALNPRAMELMVEVSRACRLSMRLEAAPAGRAGPNELFVATDFTNLEACDSMLLYLTSQTWTRGDGSAALGEEVKHAMDLGMNVLLAHEMPGIGGQAERFGCEFGTFFSCIDGATPGELLKRGVYSTIAVPFKGGAWRSTSVSLMGLALGMKTKQAKSVKNSTFADDLGLGLDSSTSANHSVDWMLAKLIKLTARLRAWRAARSKKVSCSTEEDCAPIESSPSMLLGSPAIAAPMDGTGRPLQVEEIVEPDGKEGYTCRLEMQG